MQLLTYLLTCYQRRHCQWSWAWRAEFVISSEKRFVNLDASSYRMLVAFDVDPFESTWLLVLRSSNSIHRCSKSLALTFYIDWLIDCWTDTPPCLFSLSFWRNDVGVASNNICTNTLLLLWLCQTFFRAGSVRFIAKPIWNRFCRQKAATTRLSIAPLRSMCSLGYIGFVSVVTQSVMCEFKHNISLGHFFTLKDTTSWFREND